MDLGTEAITSKVEQVKDLTRMERTGTHSHIRGKGFGSHSSRVGIGRFFGGEKNILRYGGSM